MKRADPVSTAAAVTASADSSSASTGGANLLRCRKSLAASREASSEMAGKHGAFHDERLLKSIDGKGREDEGKQNRTDIGYCMAFFSKSS